MLLSSLWRWRLIVFGAHLVVIFGVILFVGKISQPIESDRKWDDVPFEKRIAAPQFSAAGKTIYTQYCAACHGAEGKGGTGPSLNDDEWLHGGERDDVIASIKNGYPEKGMAAWQHVLDDIAIEQVAAYVLTLKD